MKKFSKKTGFLFLMTLAIWLLSSVMVSAEVNYVPLEPTFIGLPAGSTTAIPFGEYLTRLFTTAIGLAIILAVLMIVWGGFQYLSTDAITDKEEGKEKWTQAIYGLVLVLASYLLLQTINKQIVEAPNKLSTLQGLTSHKVQPIEVDTQDERNRILNHTANSTINSLNDQAARFEALGDTTQAALLRDEAERIRRERLTEIYEDQGSASQSSLNALIRDEATQLQEAGNAEAAKNLLMVGSVLTRMQGKTDDIKRIVAANLPSQTAINAAKAELATFNANTARNRASIEGTYGVNSPEAIRFRDAAALNATAARTSITAAEGRLSDFNQRQSETNNIPTP